MCVCVSFTLHNLLDKKNRILFAAMLILRGEIILSLGGHPGTITIAASKVVEGYSLLKNEYDMLHTVIPTIKRQFQQVEDEYLNELRSSLSARNSHLVNSASGHSRLSRADFLQGHAPLELVAWEPCLPHFLPGTPFAHSPSSKRQYPDTVLKEIHEKGKKIWQYVSRDGAPVRKRDSGSPLMLWSKLYEKGLKAFFNFHVGEGRALSEEDILYLATDKKMWYPSKTPEQSGGWVPMKGFLETFWPWFQAFVAMIVSTGSLWHSLTPRFICGFSTEQAEMALKGTEEGTFVIKVSASCLATVVFCVKRPNSIQQVRTPASYSILWRSSLPYKAEQNLFGSFFEFLKKCSFPFNFLIFFFYVIRL